MQHDQTFPTCPTAQRPLSPVRPWDYTRELSSQSARAHGQVRLSGLIRRSVRCCGRGALEAFVVPLGGIIRYWR